MYLFSLSVLISFYSSSASYPLLMVSGLVNSGLLGTPSLNIAWLLCTRRRFLCFYGTSVSGSLLIGSEASDIYVETR